MIQSRHYSMDSQTLHSMLKQGMHVSRDAVYRLLQDCINDKDLLSAKQAHCIMVLSGLQNVSNLGDLLIRFFASCGCLLDACLIFSGVPQPSLHTWHAVISANTTFGEFERALELWRQMQEAACIQPDKVAFLGILKACGSIGALQQGRLVYEQVIVNGFIKNAAIQSAIMNMFGKCGSVKDARKVFDEFATRDVVLWGTMITAYAQHGEYLAAIELYRRIRCLDIQPDKVTFLCIIKAITAADELMTGKLVHNEIYMSELELDVVLGSTFVDMYAKCGTMEDAHAVFNRLSNRNVVTWNAILGGHIQHGQSHAALEFYSTMQEERCLKPEKVTFLCTLKACGSVGEAELGRLLHDHIIRSGLKQDCTLKSALIDMYAKCGNLDEASNIFCSMSDEEVITWNSIIGGYMQAGAAMHALELYESMQQGGTKPDKVTFACVLNACASIESINKGQLLHDQIIRTGAEVDVVVGSALVDMYSKCKCIKEGRKVFDDLQCRNVVSWNSIISGYVQVEDDSSAFDLFKKMQEAGVQPNDVTFSSILKACGNLGDILQSKLVHDAIVKSGLEVDAILVCALVDTYAHCGCLRESHWIFDQLPNRNVAAWGALIGGYVHHGCSLYALTLFQKMQSECIKADRITFLCALKGSSISGAGKEGMWLHDQIIREALGSNVAIGNTLVDMYAKCGRLDEACKVFKELSMKDVVSWGALIAGFTQSGDDVGALELFKEMEEDGKEPEKSTFLCVLKACGSVSALEHGQILQDKIIRQAFDCDGVIGNTLVDMYAKCGRMIDANKIFQALASKDVVSWNAMINGYAMQDNLDRVKLFVREMRRLRLKLDSWTYTSILAACSHVGEMEDGLRFFKNMQKEEAVTPSIEHFNCMIDALCRFGCLQDAEELLHSMPVSPEKTAWVSLLTSSKTHGSTSVGSHCFDGVESYRDFESAYLPTLGIFVEPLNLIGGSRYGGISARQKFVVDVQKELNENVTQDSHLDGESFDNNMSRLDDTIKGLNLHLDKKKEIVALGFLSDPDGVNIRYSRVPRVLSKCQWHQIPKSVSLEAGNTSSPFKAGHPQHLAWHEAAAELRSDSVDRP